MSSKPWHRIPGETSLSRNAFRIYLELGPMRSLRKVADELDKPEWYTRTLERWSSRFSWVDRAAEYDDHSLNRSAELRQQVREAAIRMMQEAALEATETIIDLSRGEMRDGASVPIMDKFGNEHGSRPSVPAQVRIQAAIRAQECIGIIPPKRIEHTGRDGEPIEAAINVVKGFDDDELRAYLELAEKLAEKPDEKESPLDGSGAEE